MPDKSSPRAHTRISNACLRCRQKKIRCTGIPPCPACAERSLPCVFDGVGKKVMVDEVYLNQLVAKASHRHRQGERGKQQESQRRDTTTPPPRVTSDALQPSGSLTRGVTPIEDAVPSILNPLTSSESFFLVDSSGRQRYLGSSSSLSFSWQIRCLLKQATGDYVHINLVPTSEEDTYGMASTLSRAEPDSVDGALPTQDYAGYLAHTALFHLGSIYHLFEKDDFMTRLARFYDENHHVESLRGLWETQLLLVIALGKMFLRRGASSLGPPGHREFLRALSMSRDALELWDEPVLRIEVLCLISLYLLMAGMRTTAYTYIGRALRLALSLGMNREAPPDYLTSLEHQRRRRLWWTLYIIDRKLSMIMGAPVSITDHDIDIPKPRDNDCGFPNTALVLHAKLASLGGKVMQAAYRVNGVVDRSFITGIQDMLSSMVKLADDFKGDLSINLRPPCRVPRVAATLHIEYYQCTIIAMRPILFVLLKQRLNPTLNGLPAGKTVSEPVKALIEACMAAATKIIDILAVLYKEDLVEPFLSLDLAAVFSAGFILALMSLASPHSEIDESYLAKAEEILGWMASQGSAPASSRRSELTELRSAVQALRNDPTHLHLNHNNPPNSNSAGWLWDVINIDERAGGDALLSASAPIDLTFDVDMGGHDWFWAETSDSQISALPTLDLGLVPGLPS